MDRRGQHDLRRGGHPEAPQVVVYLDEPDDALLSFRQIVGSGLFDRIGRMWTITAASIFQPTGVCLRWLARSPTRVGLLPPPMIIEMDPPGQNRVSVRDETGTKRVPFEVLGTSGEQGAVFDTSGNLANAALVNRARRFILVHKLTGTDAESLALLAKQKPALLAQLLECGEDK